MAVRRKEGTITRLQGEVRRKEDIITELQAQLRQARAEVEQYQQLKEEQDIRMNAAIANLRGEPVAPHWALRH
jgi:predicted RNase H-like nuclease (RuvC/YqgF family)